MSSKRTGFMRVIDIDHARSLSRQLFMLIMCFTLIFAGGILVAILATMRGSAFLVTLGVIITAAGFIGLLSTYDSLFNQIANGSID